MRSGESGRVFRVAVLCVVALIAGAGSAARARVEAQKSLDPMQQKTPPNMPGSPPADDISGMPESPISGSMKEQRIKSFNDERHKRLEDDVAKLQSLTNELKVDVDKANKDELSLDVIRKAGEIEKLAHDVQSRMKN